MRVDRRREARFVFGELWEEDNDLGFRAVTATKINSSRFSPRRQHREHRSLNDWKTDARRGCPDRARTPYFRKILGLHACGAVVVWSAELHRSQSIISGVESYSVYSMVLSTIISGSCFRAVRSPSRVVCRRRIGMPARTFFSGSPVDLSFAEIPTLKDNDYSRQKRPPLVVLHGLLGSSSNWRQFLLRPQVQPLTQNRRVLTRLVPVRSV